MKIISQKLHASISLATPHLGTLFSDSQIVSTGEAITYVTVNNIFCVTDIYLYEHRYVGTFSVQEM